MGALEIPIGTYHRSISGKEGSIVLNQPTRDKFFDPAKEFIPQKLDQISLIKARKTPPVYWIWEKNDQIKKSLMFNPLEKKLRPLLNMNKTQKGISTKINNSKNLNLIINSDTYKLAYEDIGLLNRNEMRGVRMLLEITKPDLILEENKILSTIIIFGGANIAEESKQLREN